MDNSIKTLKKIIIIIVIILIIITIILLLTMNSNNHNENEIKEEEFAPEIEEYTPDNNVKKVNEKTQYYKIKDIVDRYFQELKNINGSAKNDLDKEESDFSLLAIKNMLSSKYIEEFNVKDKNIIEDSNKYINKNYIINNMYKVEKSQDIKIFLLNLEFDNSKEDNLLIVTDYNNQTFEIYLNDYIEKYNYNEEMEKLSDIDVNSIENNEFNEIKNVNVKNEDVAVDYFNNYKYNMLNNPEKAYNLLDKEYREKRFGSLQEYQKYINENEEIFKEIVPTQYLVNNYENYIEYVCKDKYENLYIFKETAIMDYTVQLDTYTITTDKFKEEYSKANNNKKVIMNIDKFIQMINNYDYKAAYEVLNMSFKEKYFKTEEEFKKYMQNNYYRYNDISLEKFSDENGTYVYNTTIQNKLNKEEQKEMNIIMKLNNDTNFEMSFEVIENRR